MDGTCLGVSCVTTKCWISFNDMKRSKADTANQGNHVSACLNEQALSSWVYMSLTAYQSRQ